MTRPRRSKAAPLRIRDAVRALEATFPPFLHDADGDPPPFAFGDPDAPLRRMMVALDVDRATVAEAARGRADLLLVHHPPFFRAPRTLAFDTEAGGLAQRLFAANLAVYALHYALDQAPGGTADALAGRLGLRDARPLEPGSRERRIKLVVYVPDSHKEALRAALADAGLGKTARYDACSFAAEGEGAFRPGKEARPFVGRRGALARVPEWRLEVAFPERLRAAAVEAVRRHHPYEEPAFDLLPTLDGDDYGLGRVGTLPRPAALADLARTAGVALASREARWAAPSGNPVVRRAAVWPGTDFPLALADPARFDAVVTGELGYHKQASLLAAGVGLVLVGHGESERPVLAGLARTVARALPSVKVGIARNAGIRLQPARGDGRRG